MIDRYAGMTLKDWYRDIRGHIRRVYSYFIRGYYGVAPMDSWSLDRHVFRVLARGMRLLAKNPHGYPTWIPEEYSLDTDEQGSAVNTEQAVECWQDWLIAHAEWLEWYLADEIEGLYPNASADEVIAAVNKHDEKYKLFTTVILPNVVKHMDSLWD
jgi:hypothetical protein